MQEILIAVNPPEMPIWGFWVKQVATPIVTVLGLTGNTLSFLVMGCSKRLRKQSYSQLLCILAIFDSLNLIINQVELIDEMNVYKSGHQNSFHRDFPDSVCKIYNFLKHVFLLGSSWLVVCLSVERVQAVCFPFRRTFLHRRFSVAIFVTITIAILSLTQIFRILFIENVNGMCMVVQEYLTLYVYLHQYGYHLSLLFALPCVIVLSCNFAVIYQIYVIRKEAGDDCPPSLGSTRKATTMLLLIGFVFIITMFPQFVCTSVLLYYTDESRRHIGQHIMLKMRPYLELFSVVSYTNYCINFAIYVLCGRSFQWELCRMFKCNRRRNIFREEQTKRKEEEKPLQG
ncbi:lysophosphatidic acid receptor 4-like [Saccostrea echinata]|uniref:lysophosphatidic acid receptor 4-like n=1 Tax=Saccostrea echinata TaxID=191078 RepID=UPI002A83D831|nr:lysophosphatidic acid receptor 4-like [Saccostrea echinata]